MITLALIGKGKWGSRYLNVVNNIPDVEIKYVVTRNYKELQQYNDINGIIIATPDSTHTEIAKEFPNKYLLIEKPFATSLKDALEINNNKVMVGHIYLYNKGLMEKLKKVGKINRLDIKLCNIHAEENTTPLWYLAPHGVSLAVYFLGEPQVIKAEKINENLSITLKYEKSECHIETGWNYSEKLRKIVAHGEYDSVDFDDTIIQSIAPLENELRSFIAFIKGEKCVTGLEHAIKVTKVLDKIQEQLK